ncbi:hypothetical protein HYT00_00295 [Candidatus Giovannonibacteria bacterium]|nr:hypothetical protein [Candidatus Giovannonibacteria bacterium]
MNINKLLLLVIVYFISLTFSSVLAEEIKEPVYNSGDSWRINYSHKSTISATDVLPSGTYDIVFDGKEFTVFTVENGERGAEYLPLGRVRRSFFVFLTPEPFEVKVPMFKFPLVEGTTWEGEFFSKEGTDRRGSTVKAKVTVLGQEEVAVPAGTFRAYKISREEALGQPKQKIYTYWYSPVAKCVVKMEVKTVGPVYRLNLQELPPAQIAAIQ